MLPLLLLRLLLLVWLHCLFGPQTGLRTCCGKGWRRLSADECVPPLPAGMLLHCVLMLTAELLLLLLLPLHRCLIGPQTELGTVHAEPSVYSVACMLLMRSAWLHFRNTPLLSKLLLL